MFFFFFQAEDGIRDLYVTGVQTCALPILLFATSYKQVAYMNFDAWPSLALALHASKTGVSTRGRVNSREAGHEKLSCKSDNGSFGGNDVPWIRDADGSVAGAAAVTA